MMNDKQFGVAIREAIKQGDPDEVVSLIGNDPAGLHRMTPFGTWLHVAAAMGKLEIVKRLVAMGADVSMPGGISEGGALEEAASEGHVETAQFLLSCGAELDVSEPERNPLFGAIYGGHTAVANLLIDSGIDVNATYIVGDGQESNAVSFARRYGRTEILALLAAAGAKRTAPSGKSPQDEVISYFADRFGPVEPLALQEIVPNEPPIQVHVILPSRRHRFVTLFTTGMSSQPMRVPLGQERFAYAEAFIQLPSDWPYQNLDDPNHAWPITWLRQIALYPHLNQTWLGGPLTILANGDPPQPLGPNVRFSSLLLMVAAAGQRSDGQAIQLYRLLPLYPEERELELRSGIPALLEAMQRHEMPFIVELDRPSVAEK